MGCDASNHSLILVRVCDEGTTPFEAMVAILGTYTEDSDNYMETNLPMVHVIKRHTVTKRK